MKEWKKKRLENKKKRRNKNCKKEIKTKTSTSTSSNGEVEYDEEDSKIISETTSKGYCYFKRQLPTEERELIGDISPKAVTDSGPTLVPIATTSQNANSVVDASCLEAMKTDSHLIYHCTCD